MHLLFGVAGAKPSKVSNAFNTFKAGIEKMYQTDVKIFDVDSTIAGLSGTGNLVGKAQYGNSFLLLLGALHKPVPDWDHGSPLDDPDKTAEYLLNRYRKKGVAFLSNTSGAFVVALWDGEKNRFILANDPRGMRTAFYRLKEGIFSFSTTIYALNCVEDEGLEIDRSLEDFLLGYEFLPWQRTLYKGVLSLAAGMVLIWESGNISTEFSHPKNYSELQLENRRETDLTNEKAGDILYHLFMTCLEDMLPTNKKVAILLGGFDSALVAISCSKLGKEVETYSFRFPETRFNQAYVEEVAELAGGKHHWIDIDPQVLECGLSQYPLLFNQPSGMPHYLVQTAHVLKKMAKDGHTHCLTGDGCDELFLGYPMVFRRARFFERHSSVLNWLSGPTVWILSKPWIEDWLGQPARFIRNFLNISRRPLPRRGHISNRILDEHTLYNLRRCVHLQGTDAESLLASLSVGLEKLSPLRLAFHGKSMPGLNRVRNDGATSASGLTLLSPYQHPLLATYVQSLPEIMLRPSNKKIRDSNLGKSLLLKSAERKTSLPTRIIYQKKDTPVAGMADTWYMTSLRNFLLTTIDNLPFEYNKPFVNRLLSPKFAERAFRIAVPLGNYILKVPALLATYASFNYNKRKSACEKSK